MKPNVKKWFAGTVALLAVVWIGFAQFDIGSSTSVETLQSPILCGTNCTNAAIDVSPYVGTLKVIQTVGRLSGTTPTNIGVLMTSTGSVAGGQWVLVTNYVAVTDGTNTQSLSIDKRAIRKFLRYHMELFGTTPTGMVSVVAVGSRQSQ
jgi:hypothetical protein